jgi:phosphoglycerate dehydrogenase-like enzyme
LVDQATFLKRTIRVKPDRFAWSYGDIIDRMTVFVVGTDVFPVEPVAPDDPIREVTDILFSAHRAGALATALQQIGALVLEDLSQISRGLPPVSCRRAERETLGMLRSTPIEAL